MVVNATHLYQLIIIIIIIIIIVLIIEATVHAMHAIFEADETDGILLIDATNAFNSLNRAAALHNIRILCLIISVFAINTYRIPARLFITGGKEILSAEGTTQGDPLSMGVYALSVQPLITALQTTSSTKQCWFADDASGCLLYTSPSPRDLSTSRMPSSA